MRDLERSSCQIWPIFYVFLTLYQTGGALLVYTNIWMYILPLEVMRNGIRRVDHSVRYHIT